MGLTNFPNGVSSFGTPIIGNTRSDIHTGNTFWVDSGNTDSADGGDSGTYSAPFATIDYAVGRCTANNGDVIYVKEGHAETISTADQIDVDVAGVSIIGLGNGTDRPTLTYTVAAGEVAVGADNVLIENIVFTSSVTAVLIAVDIEDGVDYCTIRNCQFDAEAANTDEFNVSINMVNNNTGCVVENCLIDMELGGAAQGIFMTADTKNTVIRNNRIQGDFSVGCISNDTTACNEILIQGNILQNGDGGGIGTVAAIVLLTASTGIIADNYIMTNVASDDAAVTADACVLFNNQYSETVASGVGIVTTPSAWT